MNQRYIGALVLVPLLVFILLGGYFLKLSVLFLSLGGMYEFYKVTKVKGYKPIEIVGYILCIGYNIYISIGLDVKIAVGVFLLVVFLLMIVPVLNTEINFIDIALTILPCFYVAVFFSFILLISMMNNGKYLLWLIFISSWCCDTLAYYFGRAFGKHKLIPKVSPKKTVEGSLGGLLGSVIGCTVYGFIISKYGVNIALYHYVIIGILGGIFGQFGDLVASSIKRNAGVKDYSNLIPGHGGILDRFDSILFVAVVVFYYLSVFIG
ncbi:MAG: phosphatidate cytidylyltransferase [Clostridium sp.]|uniref:phosphatidate cytidylyltransferase n=1 Tax=Clostridium culturomicium TaxID=1499683 RepID=UPI00058CAEF9|nr:phosphatidate cytidylyltransferase [Clostridium culturomicium]MDU4889043.1 phosphatidate cytidylyltransferase [Clostridium sp.]MDU7083313.1 phosphatidate cytidylyltransferase [Clostridium sp.]